MERCYVARAFMPVWEWKIIDLNKKPTPKSSSPPSPIIGTPEASAVEGGWGGEGQFFLLTHKRYKKE